jgi:hypothetical protein
MEDVEGAQLVLEDGNPEEAKRMVQSAVERFINAVKDSLMRVHVSHKVELGRIFMTFELADFDNNSIELTLKAWTRTV